MTEFQRPLQVFVSYSHKDERYRQELEKHLSPLRREGLLSVWHDRLIGPGKEWAGQIDAHLNQSQLVLLLVSADFLASDYCYDVEMKRALERHADGTARVVPIILRPVQWHSSPFKHLQALPKDGKPVRKWPSLDEGFDNVAAGIRSIVDEMGRKSRSDDPDRPRDGNGVRPLGHKAETPKTKSEWVAWAANSARPVGHEAEKAPEMTRIELTIAGDRLQVVIHIQRQQGRYRATRRIGGMPQTRWLDDLQLDSDSPLKIKGEDHLLHEPLDVLLTDGGGKSNAALEFFFDEQGQFELGAFLYQQLFAGLTSDEERALERAALVDLVIATSDPFAARLPWVLLVRKNHFLAAGRWSIALGVGGDVLTRSCELPASPKLLVVCPNPCQAPFPDTQADEHLQELEAALRARDPLLAQGRRLLVARTWDECRQLLRQQQPEVLYYYGHGEGDAAKSRLIFVEAKGRPRPVPVAELAHCLGELPLKPLVAYLNCCHGDAGGALNVGGQLAEIIPAVVTNRTVAFLTQARAQAKRFWEETLLFGTTPHDAVRQLYGLIDEPEFTLRNPRWMTPVFYRGYGAWNATPVRDASVILDPFWREKIDREHQFGMAFAQTTRMLRDESPRGVAFVWFGTEHDGMERFHERLKVDLGDMLPEGVKLIEYRPHWPPEMRAAEPNFDPCPSFRQMYLHACGDLRDLSDLASRVRRQVGADARKTLVYIRHQVIAQPDDVNGLLLRQYLLWWDRQLRTMLAPGQFCLLGISYQSQNPLQFADVVNRRLELEYLPYQHGLCRILPPLGQIEEVHLRDFVRTHKITIPEKGRSELLRAILQRTEGRYDAVIRELEGLVERGFADVIKAEGATALEDWKLV